MAVDSVRLLDEQTFETLDRYPLQQQELACSITSVKFAGKSGTLASP